MPLITQMARILVTADNADALSGNELLERAGPGVYRIGVVASAAADATISIRDGMATVVSLEPIPTKVAGSTYPPEDAAGDRMYRVQHLRGDRPIINIVDGTNAEILLTVVKE